MTSVTLQPRVILAEEDRARRVAIERRQRQCLGQLAEESFNLVLIVDH